MSPLVLHTPTTTVTRQFDLTEAIERGDRDSEPKDDDDRPLTVLQVQLGVTLPNQRFGIPTDDQISKLGPSTQGKLPASGLWALFVPPALTEVLPYLFKAPQTYNNFVADGARDLRNHLAYSCMFFNNSSV
ncbi:predicted protein [Histoplasma capsulatum H143]|uniref:Uncharacterized protein n=1 Tax=Ajellomyces capsulatus (strain H143) TaxID=544712 RepID=C6HGC1_AJECH|nr:predicted protein [Histoplasma capsulatum H143]